MLQQLRLPVLLLALLQWLPSQLRAQTLDPTFHIPAIYGESWPTDAAQMPNGQYVVAGYFTRANGQASKGLARFDAAGVEDQAFRQSLSGAAIAARNVFPMANGQLMVQGSYSAGTVQRNYMFRLNADGTLDPGFNLTLPNAGTLPRVDQIIVQPDGRVLVTGLYLTNGNNYDRNLFRVLSDGSRDPSFNVTLTTTSQPGSMLLQPDGKIIVRGEFRQVNGVNSNRGLNRLNSDGSLDTGFQSAIQIAGQQRIDCIALDGNGAVLVGGVFITAANVPAQPLYRLLNTGALDPTFTAPASLLGRYCNQIEVLPNGQILVLAATYSANSTSYSYNNQLIKLQPTGGIDANFQQGNGPDSYLYGVRSLANGNFLTWGAMNNYAGLRRTLALVQPSGAPDASFAPLLQRPGIIDKIARQADGKYFIAGKFNTIDGHPTDCVARLLSDGQPDLTFAWRQPNSAAWVLSALAGQADGQLLVAGSIFDSNSSVYQPVFERLTTSGNADPGFVPAITLNTSAHIRIQLLAAQANGQIVVGGTFTDAAGKANLTRLTASGSVEPTFTPMVSQPEVTYGVAQADGNFICIVTAPATGEPTIMRLLPSGAPDPSFAYIRTPGRRDNLQLIAQVPGSGEYIVGGVVANETQVLARISATGTAVAGFATPFRPLIDPTVPQSGVNAIAVQNDGRILVGGTLRQTYPYTSPATPLARLVANGQADPGFNPAIIANPASSATLFYGLYSVSALLVQPDDAIMVGGYFPEAGGQPATGLVRLRPAGVLAVRSGSSTQTEVWPVPAQATLHLKLEASARPQRVTLLDALGRVAMTQPVTQPELTLNTAPLARGLYVLRVDYASGPATRRVVLE